MSEEEKRPPRRERRRNGSGNNQKSLVRQERYARELKKLNVHKPARTARHKDVVAMTALKESLRETWAQVYAKAHEFRFFSEKQQKFARFYALNGRSNKSEAMRLAGYKADTPWNLAVRANGLLKLPGMDELIKAYEFEEKARMKLTVEDVVVWFQSIAKAAMETQDFTNANRAMENLAKYLGMFIEKREITHRVIQNKDELDARIAELTAVLREAEPEIERNLRIN
jgi:hypothetical protein